MLGRIIIIIRIKKKNLGEKDIRKRINYVVKIKLFMCNRCSLKC